MKGERGRRTNGVLSGVPTESTRRFFLRSAGATIALPVLRSALPGMAGGALALQAAQAKANANDSVRRFVAVGNLLGFYRPEWFPKTAGRDYETPRLLKPLLGKADSLRDDLTVYRGLDHGHKGGHFAVHSFLSGVLTMDSKGQPDGNISLDQLLAESSGGATRFPSLTVGSETGIHGGCQMCWTRSGTRVPPIPGPRELFTRLFVSESAGDIARTRDQLALRGSILDAVHGDAKSLGKRIDAADREKLDAYLTAVRDVEKQLERKRDWVDVPKPDAPFKRPTNKNMVEDLPLLYGKKQSSIDALLVLEAYQMTHFARFLRKLKSIPDPTPENGGGTLLDSTAVLFGSGMGDANAHRNTDLPILLAGGGFGHGEFKSLPTNGLSKVPLSNLHLSLAQWFGLERDTFANSTGTFL